jgi:uncharacterized membrane protein YbhN (UPF0104 family)
LRAALARHLYAYLALVVGLSGLLTVLLARQDLRQAWTQFDARYVWPVLGLTLLNYGLRFLKWQWMLRTVELRIPAADSARIYFACFSMTVTPFRLGELYKLIFLKRLHAAPLRRTTPVLLLERATDVVAVLSLAALRLDLGGPPFFALTALGLAFLLGSAAALPPTRRILLRLLGQLPGLRRRRSALAVAVEHNRALLRPPVLAGTLLLSVLAWFSECLGLWLVLRALAAPLPLQDATWIYALATALGNATFLPGGLGSTEATLIGLLLGLGLGRSVSLPATILIRAATLWLAVATGLLVSWLGRHKLRWREARAEVASNQPLDSGA